MIDKGPQKETSYAAIFFAGILVGLFLLELFIPNNPKTLYEFSQDQGSTIAAIVTMVALVIAWRIHERELKQQNLVHSEMLNRKANSIRARMADATSALLDYTQGCYQCLESGSKKFPDRPTAYMEVFYQAVEYLDSSSSNEIDKMISFYQVCNSRLRREGTAETISHKDDCVTDLAYLNAHLLRYFDFSRRNVNILAPIIFTIDDLSSGLRALTGDEWITKSKKYNNSVARIASAAQQRRWGSVVVPNKG